MARTTTFTFSDPIPYQAALRAADVEILPAAKGNFRAKLIRIDFDRLSMKYVSETLPRVSYSALKAKRAFIAFLTDENQPPACCGGLEVTEHAIIAGGEGSTRHARTSGSCHWAGMSLPSDEFAAVSRALMGHELTAGSVTRLVRPDHQHMTRLVGLHASARHLADAASDILEHPEVSRALEHELIYAMVTCLADEVEPKSGSGWRHHSAIIERFEEFLAANYERPLHLAEICAGIGASVRTLQICCEEHLGMGPIRYLWLRRMHLARRALIQADPVNTTVTQIATNNGFWELGRFAASYKKMFGESPSASLHRPLDDWRVTRNRPSGFSDSQFA